ncbi:MAG: hypothetical protein ACYTG5_20455 [Planctomycetota bacterium]|jgi:hypothetical protein
MRSQRQSKVDELLKRLDRLEATKPSPEQKAIFEVARQAIMDELTRLLREEGLAVYSSGGNLDAISLAG